MTQVVKELQIINTNLGNLNNSVKSLTLSCPAGGVGGGGGATTISGADIYYDHKYDASGNLTVVESAKLKQYKANGYDCSVVLSKAPIPGYGRTAICQTVSVHSLMLRCNPNPWNGNIEDNVGIASTSCSTYDDGNGGLGCAAENEKIIVEPSKDLRHFVNCIK